jgi:hypothetical protein
MKSADEPQDKENYNQQAQNPAQTSAAIASVSIIPAAATEQHYDDYDQ